MDPKTFNIHPSKRPEHQRGCLSEIRVRYAETDQMGIAHHSSYLLWFEVGRTELLRTLGYSYSELEKSGTLLPVTEAHCNFLRPSRYDEVLTIETCVGEMTRVRTTFHYFVYGQDQILRAQGTTTLASLNSNYKPIPTPPKIAQALKTFQR